MKIQIKETPKHFDPFAVEILFENLEEAKDTSQQLYNVLENAPKVGVDFGTHLMTLFKNLEKSIKTHIKQFES
jgi:HD-GYP domain-containing protein (c-di-GMP phosphodiesterase class II)